MSTEQNLDATVFVYRNILTGEINAHYLKEATNKAKLSDWQQIATLDPRAWIQNNYLQVNKP